MELPDDIKAVGQLDERPVSLVQGNARSTRDLDLGVRRILERGVV